MAIIFENQSKCAICGEVLTDDREFTIFPPFISNAKDLLFLFNDMGMHLSCINNHPLGERALIFRDKYYEHIPSVRSVDGVDGHLINNPEDIISFGLLTSNKDEELFKFNFWVIDRRNLNNWKDKNEFIRIALAYNNERKWESLNEFNYLDYLINSVNDKPI